jgi:AraC-like DNA-binding protein
MEIVDSANGLDHLYAPHLLIRSIVVGAGEEWSPQSAGWSLIEAGSGTGYWLEEQSRVELETGTVLLLAENVPGRILASRLNGMTLNLFTVMPERLTGLITQGEQNFFKQAASRRELACQILPPDHAVAVKMKTLCGSPNRSGLLFRLILLQLLIEVFGKHFEQVADHQPHTDVKERLRVFLLETPAADLLGITLDELAQITHCTPRHLSRVFFDLVGMSFRDKRAEIRLACARELLATRQSKMVDVAFESGFKSLSLFNRMFTRQFGISPGRWRQKNANGANGSVKNSAGQRRVRSSAAANNKARFQRP